MRLFSITAIMTMMASIFASIALASHTGDGSGGCWTFQYRDVNGNVVYYWTTPCR